MNNPDVVVVGGGILGCSAALHLGQRGATVTVLEAGSIGAGTTSAGGGFVALWAAGAFPDWGREELELERYSLDFYRGLAAEGLDLSLNETGSLWLAVSERGWDAHLRPIADHPGVAERRTLDPAEVEELTEGVVSASGVIGGVLHPRGVHITTTKAAAALAQRSWNAGVEFQTGTPAEEIVLEGGRAVGVRTAAGLVEADLVVVAAGAWSKPLLRRAGYEAPMVPLVATRLVTEPLAIPPTLPTLMIEELSFAWIRGDEGRLLWGCEYEVPPRYDYVNADPPARLDRIETRRAVEETMRIGTEASAAIPALSRARQTSVSHGLPCYTADFRGLVGPVPGFEALHLLSGDNQAGVTHAPGYGRLIADLVTQPDSPPPEAAAFRPDRFESADPREIAARAAGHIFELSDQPAIGPKG